MQLERQINENPNSIGTNFSCKELIVEFMLTRMKHIWQVLQQCMQKKKVRQFIYIGTILVSLLFIGYAIQSHWTDLKHLEFKLAPIYLILAVMLYPLGALPTTLAWHWILQALGVRTTFQINMRIYAQSLLPRHIPGLVWYVTSRTLLYQEQGVGAGVILGATALESLTMALSGFCLSIVYFTSQMTSLHQFAGLQVLIPLSIIIVIIFVVWASGGTRWLEKIIKRWQKDGNGGFHLQRKGLWISIGWIFLAWIGGGILLWMLINAITPLDWRLLPAIIGIWGAAGAVSLTLGIGVQGMGLREVTLGAMLSLLISPLMAVVVAVIFRLTLLLGELLWVFLVLTLSGDKFVKLKK
jgi:hypothetical protein